MQLRGVDQDIDLAADHAGEIAHRLLVGHVERHALELRQRGRFRALLPRLGDAEPHDLGARLDQRLGQRLPDRALAVGDQHLAEFRIAGHLAQHRIVRHVRSCPGAAARSAPPVRFCRDARARARATARRNRDADAPARPARHRASPCRAGAARARDSKARSSDAARCRRSARPRRSTSRHSSRCERQFTQAERGGYCTVPQSKQCCSSKRPSAAAAVRRSAARLRPPGGNVGRRSARTGLRGLGLPNSLMRAPARRRRSTGRGRS